MKTRVNTLLVLPALIAGLVLMLPHRMAAQTFTNLFNFNASTGGANPQAGLVLSGDMLYGTTVNGGTNGDGTVFGVSTDGTVYTNLHSFVSSDGANPEAGLVLSGTNLYGTTYNGGTGGYGTVFALNTDGSGFTNLYSFSYSDGANPQAGLILSGNTLYGTTASGGEWGEGEVFAINTDSTGFTNIYSFTGGSDGEEPEAGLILSGDILYGTTRYGGYGYGTVFAVNTEGTGFTTVYPFTGSSDGQNPVAGLVLSGNTLYGTAQYGGSSGWGTAFSVNTDGSGFSLLHGFTGGDDGGDPQAGLVLLGNILYGTAEYNSNTGAGTVFSVTTNGLDFTTVYGFPNYFNGVNPEAGLLASGLTLYGTTYNGGNDGGGTVFGILLPCPTITLSSNDLPGGKVTVNYNQTIIASGGVAPVNFALTPGSALPGGVTLSAAGVLSGVAQTPGDFNFGVTATDANGCSATNSYSIEIGPSPFATIYNFAPPADVPPYSNQDGAIPSGVILSGNILYGTTTQGGGSATGTVFAVNTDNTGFTNLYEFTATSDGDYYSGTNGDGSYPYGGLVLSGDTLYGTTTYGGTGGSGTIFAVNTDGSGFKTLYNFSADPTGVNSDGSAPLSQLIISGNTLYGTASGGGTSYGGTVFAINIDGTDFTNLYNFTYGSDGGDPQAGLVLSGNTLYGTAVYGGEYSYGTIFAINTDSTGFTNVYSFSAEEVNSASQETNSDGASPCAALIISGNTLYGTAPSGGMYGDGTVFAVNTDGSGFTTLYNFSALTTNSENEEVNFDGAYPQAPLTLSGSTLYGTAENGGLDTYGTVFALNIDGTGFTTLYDFNYSDGAYPNTPLVLADNFLYGTTQYGGISGYGTIFDLTTCPTIGLTPGTLPSGNIDDSYGQTFAATGGVAPYTFSLTSGSLPDGLSLSPAGVLSGTPTNMGSFNFTVTAADANGCQVMNTYAVNIFAHFAVLHTFSALSAPVYDSGTNGDGANPYAGLVLSGNTVYGVAESGGRETEGTVFAVNTDGTDFTTLHSYDYSDGAEPNAGLVLSGSYLYGPAMFGGPGENGLLFSLNIFGPGFSNIYSFTGQSDGYEPTGKLLLSGGFLYGAARGGNSYAGTIFKVESDGSNFTVLHSFTDTGSDGGDSQGGFVLSGTNLYGTSPYGGTSHYGLVFTVDTNGAVFTNLHSFNIASDGAYPNGGLVLAGETLYGTANEGGSFGYGTVFSIHTDGTDFTVLHNFTAGSISNINNEEYLINSDGAYPNAGLVLSGTNLYGMAPSGGTSGFGTIFAINTGGTVFTTLYNFTNGNDGSYPSDPLIVVGNTLYGTAEGGGSFSNGTVFALGLGGPNPAIPPVVTWNPPAPIIYGTALGSSQLDATANVPGNFAYDPVPGTVLAVGTHALSVIFTPADTIDYSSATNTVTLVVSLPPLTVTANNAIRPAGQPNPVFTGTIVGLVNGDNITAVYNTSATSNSPPGMYPIVPSLVDPDNRATNYTVTLIDGTLTVTPIPAAFNVLHGFTAAALGRPTTNSDGATPLAGLIVSGTTLYGTASSGGTGGTGLVFAVNKNGSGFTNLHDFQQYTAGCCSLFQNPDGMSPSGVLVLAGNTLYGPAENGGNGYVGALFAVETNGMDFANPHVFENVYLNNQDYPVNGDGAYPYAGLTLSADGATLYGTAVYGGGQGGGVVFCVNLATSDYTNLHSFPDIAAPTYTNSDGAAVFAGLALSGDGKILYGTAQGGGTNGAGTVFAINADGTDFTTLHSFAATSDGAVPDGTLVLAGTTLYGVAADGGASSNGTVFAINTNGTGFTNLYNFTALTNNTNSDGARPLAGLTLSTDGTVLYGTATSGGTAGYGTVFAICTNGAGFTNLYNFTDSFDGDDPQSSLVISDYSLYGTAAYGGNSGAGTIYSLTFPPPLLSITLSAGGGFNEAFNVPEVVLTWPVSEIGFSFAGFQLQSTTSLAPAAWSDVLITPSVVNQQYSVAVPIGPTQEFFRLHQHLSQ